MHRVIKSSRKGLEPNHTHFCPKVETRIDLVVCKSCDYCQMWDDKGVSHEVHCTFALATDALLEVEPAKAYDKRDLPAYMGSDPCKVDTHSLIEPKLDGARAIIHLTANGIRVHGRRRNRAGIFTEWTDNVPHVKDIAIPDWLTGTVLDAEVMVMPTNFEAAGLEVPTGSLGATMAVVGSKPARAAATQEKVGKAEFFVFDLLVLAHSFYTEEPLKSRREVLDAIFREWEPPFFHLTPRYVAHTEEAKREYVQSFLDLGYEGAVLKNHNAKYGERYAWLKVKEDLTLDVQVTGFDYGAPGGKYARTIGALRFSVIDKRTEQLREIGKCVPGDDTTREEMRMLLEPIREAGKSIPDLHFIIEVEAQSWTKGYRLRHPRPVRYRTDRSEPNTLDFTKVTRR